MAPAPAPRLAVPTGWIPLSLGPRQALSRPGARPGPVPSPSLSHPCPHSIPSQSPSHRCPIPSLSPSLSASHPCPHPIPLPVLTPSHPIPSHPIPSLFHPHPIPFLSPSLSPSHPIPSLSPFHSTPVPIPSLSPSLSPSHPHPCPHPILSHPISVPVRITFLSPFHPGPHPIPFPPHPIQFLSPSLSPFHSVAVPIPSLSHSLSSSHPCHHPTPSPSLSSPHTVSSNPTPVPIQSLSLSASHPCPLSIPVPIPFRSPSHPIPVPVPILSLSPPSLPPPAAPPRAGFALFKHPPPHIPLPSPINGSHPAPYPGGGLSGWGGHGRIVAGDGGGRPRSAPPPRPTGAIKRGRGRAPQPLAMSSLAALREGYERFDPHAYLRNNYLPPRADFSSEGAVVPWKLRCLAETFASGEIRGRTLIDVGSGPTIYQLLSACDHFEEIVATDYLAVNREELGRWVRGDPGTFDWSPFIQHVCKIEGRGEPWQEKQRRLRARLRRILPIDVHRPDPLGAPLRPPADGLLSAFCLEAVSPDRATFARALVHVGSLLRPGGHALLLGALGESFYLAGAARLPVVPLAEGDVRDALAGAGFVLRDFRSYAMPPALRTGVDDVDGVFFAHAQKPMEA